MEALFIDGDYVPDGWGGFETASGQQETVQRILFKLSARRGGFPLLPELGSRLWMLSREKHSELNSAARQYIAEALEGEGLILEDVAIAEKDTGEFELTAVFSQEGEEIPVTMDIGITGTEAQS